MSSAERWRVLLPSRISRIFRRGSVTFKPALRRSLPSTWVLLGDFEPLRAATGAPPAGPAFRYDREDYDPLPVTHAPPAPPPRPPRPRRLPRQRLRLSHGHPAGQLPRVQDRRPARGRHDAQPGALPARHADGAGPL